MKKLFKKKQFILAVLVVMLTAAIYVNWQFTDSPISGSVTSEPDKNLGDAEFVGTSNVDVSDDTYFADARNDRQKAREESLDELEEIKKSVKATDDEISEAINEQMRISAAIETEANIETLVKAKGFKDCVVVAGEDTVTVIVKSDAIENSEILQIQDVVLSQMQIKLENIKIINVE